MKNIYGKVALVVGASSGVGKACAQYMKEQGYRVYGTSRKVNFPQDDSNLREENEITMIPLDVTNIESIRKAIEYVVGKEGKINIVVNCPGYGLGGAIEDITLEEAQEIFNTNFFGIMMVCKYVLPYMRKQKLGLIVNISSVAGFISIPYQSMYSASKYALEAMTEALRMEVKQFGIRVALIEPGDMHTNFYRVTAKEAQDNSVYKDRFEKAVNEMIQSELKGPGAEIVIKEFAKILKSANPPIRRVVGFQYKIIGYLNKFVPARLVEYIVSKMY